MLLALIRRLAQDLCRMLAHQCILYHNPIYHNPIYQFSPRITVNSFRSSLTQSAALSVVREECGGKMRDDYESVRYEESRRYLWGARPSYPIISCIENTPFYQDYGNGDELWKLLVHQLFSKQYVLSPNLPLHWFEPRFGLCQLPPPQFSECFSVLEIREIWGGSMGRSRRRAKSIVRSAQSEPWPRTSFVVSIHCPSHYAFNHCSSIPLLFRVISHQISWYSQSAERGMAAWPACSG